MRLLTTIIFSLALFACSSTTKENHYYSLNLTHEFDDKNTQDKKIIIIKRIQLAPFLNGQGLVMQLGKHQIVTASHHLWAEPLEQALGKLLQQRLNNSCMDYTFETATHYLKHDSGMSLQLEIDKFHATDESTIEVAGRFWVLEDSRISGVSQRFSLSKDLKQDGYLHMVEKLNQAVTGISNAICSGIEENSTKKD